MGDRKLGGLEPHEFAAIIAERRANKMAAIDELHPDQRALVHEYGWTVVNAFLLLGIKKPRHIRHLVETVLDEFSPTRGASSCQGVRRAKPFQPSPTEEGGDK